MPQTAGYYHAAYIIVAVVYAAYGIGLVMRRRTVRRRLAERGVGNRAARG